MFELKFRVQDNYDAVMGSQESVPNWMTANLNELKQFQKTEKVIQKKLLVLKVVLQATD